MKCNKNWLLKVVDDKLTVGQLVKKFSALYKPEGSLMCSLYPTGILAQPYFLTINVNLTLPRTLYVLQGDSFLNVSRLNSAHRPKSQLCHTCCMLLHLITLIVLGERHKSETSSSRSFVQLPASPPQCPPHHPVLNQTHSVCVCPLTL
jgi:hypothetical protein